MTLEIFIKSLRFETPWVRKNGFFQLNYTKYERKLWYKIVYYIKIYKFKQQHFSIRCIFFFLIKKITIENLKFNFSTKICEIRKKPKFGKLFVSIRSTQILPDIVSDKTYIFYNDFKKYD